MSKLPNSFKPVDFSENIVIIQLGFTTESQLKMLVDEFLRVISEEDDNTPGDNWRQASYKSCEWLANIIVRTITNESTGEKYKEMARYGYIWFQNPEVLNILIGLNPDKTVRDIAIKNPDYVPEVYVPKARTTFTLGSLFPTSMDEWANGIIDDEEDVYYIKTLEQTNERNKFIIEPLEPLATLGSVVYTEEQLRAQNEYFSRNPDYILESRHLFWDKTKPIRTLNKPLERVKQPIERAFVAKDVNFGNSGGLWERKVQNVLYSFRIPGWIQAEPLFNYFSRFNSDKHVSYPEIKLEAYSDKTGVKHQKCWIVFSSDNNDASFAKLLARKFVLSHEGKSAELIFDHEPEDHKISQARRFDASKGKSDFTAAEGSKMLARGTTSAAIPPPPVQQAWAKRGGKPSSILAGIESEKSKGVSIGASGVRQVVGGIPTSFSTSFTPASSKPSQRVSSPPRASSPPRGGAGGPPRASSPPRGGAGGPPRGNQSKPYDDGFTSVRSSKRR